MVHKSASTISDHDFFTLTFYHYIINSPNCGLFIFPIGKSRKIMRPDQNARSFSHRRNIQFPRIVSRIFSGKYIRLFPGIHGIYIAFSAGAVPAWNPFFTSSIFQIQISSGSRFAHSLKNCASSIFPRSTILTVCPFACTPPSVLPEPCTSTSYPRIPEIVFSNVPCMVRSVIRLPLPALITGAVICYCQFICPHISPVILIPSPLLFRSPFRPL